MRYVIVCVAAMAAVVAVAAAPGADDIVGLWATDPEGEGGQAHVEIYEQDGRYAGRIVWLEEPVYDADDPMAGQPKVDRENPDPALRDRPVEGLLIMEGFEYDGDGRWSGGTIYDPDNGKTYKSKVKFEDGLLKVRGFIGFSLLGRTTEWTRVKEAGGQE